MFQKLFLMRRFYDLKIRTKLVGSFAVGSVVGIVIGIVGLVSTSRMSSATSASFENQMKHASNLQAFSSSFHILRADVMAILQARTAQDRSAFESKARNRRLELLTVLSVVERGLSTPEETPSVASLRKGCESIGQQLERVISLAKENRMEEANGVLLGEVTGSTGHIQQAIEQLSRISIRNVQQIVEYNASAARSAQWVIGILIVLGVVSALSWGLFVGQTVSKPVGVVVQTINAADLNTVFGSLRKDEIGDLMTSLDRFLQTIRQTVRQLVDIAASVSNATAEISASTDAMAAAADEQSMQATHVSASVEEMSKTVLENSRSASLTAETAGTAKKAAEHGGSVVEETIAGMRRIAQVVDRSADTVKTLGKSSDQIGEIVLVIEDIADQTNLLALNAAIEAARAGEQGRGFAVVADEVRRLAERTTKATKEIADMIRRIQHDTAEAVRSMEQGTEEVSKGIKLADAAGNSLLEIVEISQRVTDMITHIASASEQQAGASESIAKSVLQISMVTQESASGIQQIARTAEELNGLTDTLQRLIDKFQLSHPREEARVDMSFASRSTKHSLEGKRREEATVPAASRQKFEFDPV